VADVDEVLALAQPSVYAQAIVDTDVVLLNSTSTTKEDAIYEIVSAVSIAGRTDAPQIIEDAVWAREAQYSTGLGHGIAIPHCKSDSMLAASIAVLKLAQPIEWGALDGAPVQIVLLLVTRESDAQERHLQIFAVLARKLMHGEFRDKLFRIDDKQEMVDFLKTELSIGG
jgi:fructose-specific PTS system IIA-like component